MLKNNVEVDVKVKCIEVSVTQAKLAEQIGTSAPYVSRLIRNNDKIVGGIYDDRLIVKLTKSAVALMSNADRELPVPKKRK